MTKLSELPQVAADPIKCELEYNGTTYAFTVLQVPYAKSSEIFSPDLAEGQVRSAFVLSSLVSFEGEDGQPAPLTYDMARALPPALGIALSNKALAVNGFGVDAGKN